MKDEHLNSCSELLGHLPRVDARTILRLQYTVIMYAFRIMLHDCNFTVKPISSCEKAYLLGLLYLAAILQ